MANEFVARNGIISLDGGQITGSLRVTQGVTASLFGTASWAINSTTASFVLNAVSSSFAATASFIATSSLAGNFFSQAGNSFGTLAILGTNDNQALVFETNGSEKMRLAATRNNFLVNQTGSLGGVTASIELSGNGSNDGTEQATYQIYANHGTFAANTGYFVFNKSRGTTQGAVTAVASGDRLGMIRWNGADGASQVRAAEIYAEVDGAVSTNDMPGRIVFATTLDGASTPTERMRITNAGLVGIGTTSPINTLHVVGTGRFTDSLAISTAVSTGDAFIELGTGRSASGNAYIDLVGDTTYTDFALRIIRGSAGANATSQIIHRGTGAFSIIAQDAASLALSTTNSARLTILSGGSIGIGTTTAGSLLQVNGNTAIGYAASTAAPTNGLTVSGSVGIGTTLAPWASTFRVLQLGARTTLFNSDINFTGLYNNIYYDGAAYRYLTTAAASSIELGGGVITFGTVASGTAGNTAAGSERMRIINDGNVGIGTTAPVGRLQVSGSVVIGAGASNYQLNIFGSTTSYISLNNNNSGTGASNGFQIGLESTGEVYFLNRQNAFIQFRTNNLDRVRITADGNVGIGTTAPGARLAISGSGTGQALIGDAGFGTTNYTGISLNGTLSTTNYNFLSSPTDQSLYINRPSGVSIHFRANNTDQAIINSAGNVGIGTTSPSNLLHVRGTGDSSGQLIRVTGTGPSGSITIAHSGNGGSLGYASIGAGDQSNVFYVTTGAGTIGSGFVVNNAGNVGIGTTSPSYKLQVNGAAQIVDDLYVGNAVSGIFRILGDHGSAVWLQSGAALSAGSTKDLYFSGMFGSPVHMVLTGGGNLGIGTTSPSHKLQVIGAVPANEAISNIISFTDASSNTGYLGIARSSSTGNGAVLTSDGKLVFRVGSTTEAMTIASTGAATFSSSGLFSGNLQTNGVLTIGNQSVAGNYFLQITPSTTNRVSMQGLLAGVGISDIVMQPSGGNVGIGTTSPTEGKLVVANSGPSIIYNKETSQGVNSFWNSSDGSLVQFGVASNHPLLLFTNGSERVRITSGGNVGIGTTSPTNKLDLYVSNRTSLSSQASAIVSDYIGSTTGQYQTIGFSWASSISSLVSYWGLGFRATNFSSGLGDTFLYAGGAERLTVTNDGNVIIGGTTSTYKLHVVSAPGSILALGEASFTTGKQLLIGINASANAEIQSVHQGTAFKDILLNPSGGNVGIGTTTTAAKLDVNGAIQTDNPSGGSKKPWKLGNVVATSVVLDENNYVEVEINGNAYKLALVNPA